MRWPIFDARGEFSTNFPFSFTQTNHNDHLCLIRWIPRCSFNLSQLPFRSPGHWRNKVSTQASPVKGEKSDYLNIGLPLFLWLLLMLKLCRQEKTNATSDPFRISCYSLLVSYLFYCEPLVFSFQFLHTVPERLLHHGGATAFLNPSCCLCWCCCC